MHQINFVINLCLLIKSITPLNLEALKRKNPLPVVIWHGMGDSCCNPESMGKLIELIHQHSPRTFVHSIRIGDDEGADRKAGFFGNTNDEVAYVCRQLSSIPELSNGFNALGFSQGGLFLRAYVERCNSPPVENLVTMGSPHSGISDPPGCEESKDTWNCRLMRSIIRGGAYSGYIRDHIIQAQYIKDPLKYDTYLNYNIFLPDLNNEKMIKNQTYKENLSKLNLFAMIRFGDDRVLAPKDSSWFSSIEVGSPDKVIPMRDQPIYKEDWIGLKSLDIKGKLKFLTCPTEHMRFTVEYFIKEVIPLLFYKDVPQGKFNTNLRQTFFSGNQN